MKNHEDVLEFMRLFIGENEPLIFDTLFGDTEEDRKMYAKMLKNLKPKTAEQREAESLERMKRIKELDGKPLQIFDGPLDEPEITKEMREKLYQEFLEEVRKIIKEKEGK